MGPFHRLSQSGGLGAFPKGCTLALPQSALMSFHADQWIGVVNAAGTWVAGIGTVAAVIVALRLARSASHVQLRTDLNVYTQFTPGDPAWVDCIGYVVTNLGERPVIINAIGWVVDTGGGKEHATQFLHDGLGDMTPKRLEHGEVARFMFPLVPLWAANFIDGFITSTEMLQTLRGTVSTTVGHTVEVKPAASVLKRLRAALDEQENSSKATEPAA